MLSVVSFVGASGTAAHGAEEDTVTLDCPSDEFNDEKIITREQLEKDLRKTQASAYASGTLHNLKCQWRSFQHFSFAAKIFEWPVSNHTICLFTQYLAYTFHSAKTVRNYLNGVRMVHILMRAEPPNMAYIEVRITLKGLNKTMLLLVKQAYPLSPEILLDLVEYINLSKCLDLSFWVILVVGFFTFFRKSNLVPDTVDSYKHNKQLSVRLFILMAKLRCL